MLIELLASNIVQGEHLVIYYLIQWNVYVMCCMMQDIGYSKRGH